MSELSIQEYKEKIDQVKKDIETLKLSGTSGRRLEVLTEYLGYLEDEMQFLINEEKNNNY